MFLVITVSLHFICYFYEHHTMNKYWFFYTSLTVLLRCLRFPRLKCYISHCTAQDFPGWNVTSHTAQPKISQAEMLHLTLRSPRFPRLKCYISHCAARDFPGWNVTSLTAQPEISQAEMLHLTLRSPRFPRLKCYISHCAARDFPGWNVTSHTAQPKIFRVNRHDAITCRQPILVAVATSLTSRD